MRGSFGEPCSKGKVNRPFFCCVMALRHNTFAFLMPDLAYRSENLAIGERNTSSKGTGVLRSSFLEAGGNSVV